MVEVTGDAPADVGADVGGEGAQGEGAPSQQQGAQAAAQARRLKLLIDGKEEEFDESQVVANFKRGRNSSQLLSKVEQRRREALEAQAKADGLVSRLKTDFWGVAKELGLNPTELSEKTILEQIRLEQMTPEQRRAHELEQKLKGLEAEKNKSEEEKKNAAHAQEVERHKDELANLFLETMERTGLPKSSGRFVISRMAALYAQNDAAGLESTPDEMAEHVMAGLRAEQQGMLGAMDGEALLSHLGPEVVAKVLNANLARVRARKGAPPAVASAGQGRPAPRQPGPSGVKIGDPDFFRKLAEG